VTEIEEGAEVRLQPIGRPGRGGGVPPVIWAFAAVLVAVVGFAVAGDRLTGGPAGPDTAAGPGVPSASPARSPRPTRVPPSPTPPPFLPPIPNMDLPGAPGVVLVRRTDDDLDLRSWRPGQAVFESGGLIAGAFAGMSQDSVWADLSPDGAVAAVVEYTFSGDDEISSRVRIVGSGPTWESDVQPYGVTLAWSADSTALAIGGGPVWTVVRLGNDEPVVTTVRVAEDPAPAPSGSTERPRGEFDPSIVLPFAFSVDGRHLYGAKGRETPPMFGPGVQVDLDAASPTAVPIDRYPTEGDARLAPTSWPGEMVDPETGRVAELSWVDPRPVIAILEPDGSLREPIDVGEGASGLVWAGDDRLLVTVNTPLDSSGETSAVEARWIGIDGARGPVALSADRVNGGGQWTSRPGWALMGFQADEGLLFAVIRATDGATATVRLRQDDLADVIAIELVDPR
jgi:hypothetical protein